MPNETELRQMRDRIYGYQSEKEWQHCKENWARDGEWQWLVRENAKLIAKEATNA